MFGDNEKASPVGEDQVIRAAVVPEANGHREFLALLAEDDSGHKLRMGIDYYDGKLWYGMEVKGKPYFLTSGYQALSPSALPTGVTCDEKGFPAAPLSRDGIERYLRKESVDGGKLLAELETLFRDHAKFEHDTVPAVLARWSLGTYLYMAFPTYPYIWINSRTKQSGKSRVLELMSAVSFRKPEIFVSPTAAVVYRSIDKLGQVLIVDEFERAKDDTKAAMIEIFNAGFRGGARVPRCNTNTFEVEYFNAYCPKAFAGLNNVPDTLSSRAIELHMFPKSKKDKIRDFSPVEMEPTLQRLRDDMAIWALEHADACARLAANRRDLRMPECLDDRAADFMTPLYTIGGIAGVDRTPLDQFCYTLSKLRHADTSDTDTARALDVLRKWYPGGPSARIHGEDLGRLLSNSGMSYDSMSANDFLRSMGFEVRQLRIGGENKKGAEITREKLNDLVDRFNVVVQGDD